MPGDLLYTKHIVYPDYIAYLTYMPEQRGICWWVRLNTPKALANSSPGFERSENPGLVVNDQMNPERVRLTPSAYFQTADYVESQLPFSCPTPPVIQALILVVVDHDDAREMLCMLGDAWGFRVVEACDGVRGRRGGLLMPDFGAVSRG